MHEAGLALDIALWSFDRTYRVWRIIRSHVGGSRSRTIIEALPGNAVRLTMTLARPWNAAPGQHAYLYMPSISLWQSKESSSSHSLQLSRASSNVWLAS